MALVAIGPQAANPQTARGDVDAEQVRRAIEQGVAYLKREQQPNGSWPDFLGHGSGVTSLVTLALLNSGVPVEDPVIQKSLTYLRKLKLEQTYTVALQTMVLCAAEPKKDLLLIRQNVRWLEEQQHREDEQRKGGWGYGTRSGGVDNSNSQFALLALHEAQRVGVTVNERTWRLANAYWRDTQNGDGSWGYLDGYPGTGSMTCAGIGALVITEDNLARSDVQVDASGQITCCLPQTESLDIERALNWMARNFSIDINPGNVRTQTYLFYYLYGLERVGRLTNRRFIGNADWYREGADKLVRAQLELSGSWKGTGHAEDNQLIATSLSLLFLAKGKRPVVVSKLKHEPPNDWNRHRNDLGNLLSYVESRWGRELAWQILDPRHATPDDLLQSPVLFISGREAPQFSDAQVADLRTYIERGGFILAEACCGGGDEFDQGFRQLMQRVFPEPEYQLRLLGPEHPVWGAEERVDPAFATEHPLYGIDSGCRTSVIYSPRDLGCFWELARVGREEKLPAAARRQLTAARAMGINILAYATGRELKEKLESIATGPSSLASDNFERAKVSVAKLKHSGGWNVAPGALPTLMRTLATEANVRVSAEQREVALSDKQLFDYHVAFMHGRHGFRLSEQERKQLREYLERGGLLLADAVCTSDDFVQAFRRELAQVIPGAALEPIPASDPLLSNKYGGFDLRSVRRREIDTSGPGGAIRTVERQGAPRLEGLKIDGRWVVIFSPYDLSCALERHGSLECPGYTREDAARIGLNVLLYSLHE